MLENICHDCLDDHGTNIIKGKCECKLFYEKPSQDGVCEPCYMPGCASCETGKDHTCYECIDPSIEPTEDGECICPDGKHMDEDGTCHSCDVLGCDEC